MPRRGSTSTLAASRDAAAAAAAAAASRCDDTPRSAARANLPVHRALPWYWYVITLLYMDLNAMELHPYVVVDFDSMTVRLLMKGH